MMWLFCFFHGVFRVVWLGLHPPPQPPWFMMWLFELFDGVFHGLHPAPQSA